MNNGSNHKEPRWLLFLYIIAICVPLFYNLDAKVMRIWDEARLAVSAYEMQENGNCLVVHYDESPDMWSVKPPLMIWAQVLSIKILGYSEFATRFPSALAAFFCCLFLPWFSGKVWRSYLPGMLAGIVLVSMHGYIGDHGMRTGDYDSMLVLFTTMLCGYYFLYIEYGKQKYLYLTFISVTLAILTKGIAGLLMGPALLLYTLYRKKLWSLLVNPHFYCGLLIVLILGIGYYPLREVYNPGYIEAVFQNELGGRYNQALEGHGWPWHFYLKGMAGQRTEPWFLILPVAFLFGVWKSEKLLCNVYFFCMLIIVFYLLVISAGATKLFWYDLPAYPFISIVIGGAMHRLAAWFTRKNKAGSTVYTLKKYGLLGALLAFPYITIAFWVKNSAEVYWEVEFYRIEYYLRDVAEKRRPQRFDFIAYEGYSAQITFYKNRMKEAGLDADYIDWKELHAGDRVLAAENGVRTFIETHYTYKTIDNWYNVWVYEITGRTAEDSTSEEENGP